MFGIFSIGNEEPLVLYSVSLGVEIVFMEFGHMSWWHFSIFHTGIYIGYISFSPVCIVGTCWMWDAPKLARLNFTSLAIFGSALVGNISVCLAGYIVTCYHSMYECVVTLVKSTVRCNWNSWVLHMELVMNSEQRNKLFKRHFHDKFYFNFITNILIPLQVMGPEGLSEQTLSFHCLLSGNLLLSFPFIVLLLSNCSFLYCYHKFSLGLISTFFILCITFFTSFEEVIQPVFELIFTKLK